MTRFQRVMVTGGCGFIGSNLVRMLLTESTAHVTNLDLLTYAGNPENLAEIAADTRYRFVRGDVADPKHVSDAADGCDVILHLAAESHVDRSIEDAEAFIRTNVYGTRTILEEGRRRGLRVVVVSTDEVYGALQSVEDEPFRETTPLAPNSPYSASKASGDLLARAYHHTHGSDVVVTRCSNNYGPYQFPEKFLPLMITRAMTGGDLPIYGDGLYRRDWLHVADHCRGILVAAERGRNGAVYNFGTGDDRTNLSMLEAVIRLVGEEIGPVASKTVRVSDRPGHDRRYCVDASLASRELGWTPSTELDAGLRDTVRWYRDQSRWWQRIVSGDYLVDRKSARHV